MESANQKVISQMTDREILRHQLEQLAEVSQDCLTEELPNITNGMIAIVSYLENNKGYKNDGLC
jgi:hypothetical protein